MLKIEHESFHFNIIYCTLIYLIKLEHFMKPRCGLCDLEFRRSFQSTSRFNCDPWFVSLVRQTQVWCFKCKQKLIVFILRRTCYNIASIVLWNFSIIEGQFWKKTELNAFVSCTSLFNWARNTQYSVLFTNTVTVNVAWEKKKRGKIRVYSSSGTQG